MGHILFFLSLSSFIYLFIFEFYFIFLIQQILISYLFYTY